MRQFSLRLLSVGMLCAAVFVTGCTPPEAAPAPKKRSSGTTSMSDPTPTLADAEKLASVKATVAASSVKMVAIKVPTMTCPSGCYPTVKETLEAQEGVANVELAPQTGKDSIDNPYVFITLKGDFDAQKAIIALATKHFDEAEVVNN